MKYKIKFEIKYDDLSQGEIRDYKLVLLEQDITTEIESEYPLHIPSKDEYIELGEELYSINMIYHKVEKDSYTTIISVTSNKIIEIKQREQRELEAKLKLEQINQMRNMFDYKIK